MRRIQYDQGLATLPAPCEFFHLIGGTSTGGSVTVLDCSRSSKFIEGSLIALMLGRLKMTTTEALRQYNEIAEAVFGRKNRKFSFKTPIPFKDGAFKATTLEEHFQKLVITRRLGEYMLPETNEEGQAKTFVCAAPAADLDHPRLFRSYLTREYAVSGCRIWESARATTTASTIFKRMKIIDETGMTEDFFDGGLLYKNPSVLVLDEAMRVFGGASNLGCLISIGTGRRDPASLSCPNSKEKVLPVAFVDILKQMMTNCEQNAHQMAKRFQGSPGRYFRFTVSRGIGSIPLQEWGRIDEVRTKTTSYMEEVDVLNSIDMAVKTLCERSEAQMSGLSLQSICQSVSHERS